jgi:hypothetical protein
MLGCHTQLERPPADGTVAAAGVVDTDTYRVTPTQDPAERSGVYVPRDLEDAFAELDRMVTPAFRREFAADSTQPIEHHFGLGLWMRNNWGLWAGSRLARYFHGLGICHPDDMSGIVLNSYWRRLNSRPILLHEQVGYYREYWRTQGAPDSCSRSGQ